MTAKVTPIRDGVDDDADDTVLGADWISTVTSIDPATGERFDPFETVRPEPSEQG